MMTIGGCERQPSRRTIAIGDVHGHAAALRALVSAIDPRPSDTVVFLGDYIDRGPDSRGVIDLVLDLERRCEVFPLLGNHEEMLLGALDRRSGLQFWLKFGGGDALASYDVDRPQALPPRHVEFVRRCRWFHEDDGHIYAHANYWPNRPMAEQPAAALFWEDLNSAKSGPHYSRKTAIVGHTPQRSGRPLDLGYLVCIDTSCGFGGLLTALEVGTRRVWQSDEKGRVVRRPELLEAT